MPLVTPTWFGRPIAHEDHKRDLNAYSAIYEYMHSMPQEEAEARAYSEYKSKQHAQAAAHHLSGMKAAQGAGDMEQARKHGAMYALHVKQLGLDPYGPVPPEIQTHVADPKREKVYKFKAHRGDSFLLQPDAALQPQSAGAQAPDTEVKKSELQKGNVIQGKFPQHAANPEMQGPPAPVTSMPQRGSLVIDPKKSAPLPVQNLGWLLKNWKGVKRFELARNGTEGHMTAHMHDGRRYETPFASHSVMTDWINRPVFRGIETTVDGQPHQWGKSEQPSLPEALTHLHKMATDLLEPWLSEADGEQALAKSSIRNLPMDQLAGKQVRVYRNLHNGMFSIQHEGKVIAHMPAVRLRDAKFKVSQAGRQRVLREKAKNVHAYVEGTMMPDETPAHHSTQVTYNPYKFDSFVRAHDFSPIHEAKSVVLTIHPKHMVTADEPEAAPAPATTKTV